MVAETLPYTLREALLYIFDPLKLFHPYYSPTFYHNFIAVELKIQILRNFPKIEASRSMQTQPQAYLILVPILSVSLAASCP